MDYGNYLHALYNISWVLTVKLGHKRAGIKVIVYTLIDCWYKIWITDNVVIP